MSAVRKGDRFDFFGQVLEVVKVRRDGSFDMGQRSADAFGKEAFIDVRGYHERDLKVMRKLESNQPRRRGHAAPTRLREMDTPTVLGYELDRQTLTPVRQTITKTGGVDYGCDVLGDGTFRMAPSGDIVDFAERNRRLAPKKG